MGTWDEPPPHPVLQRSSMGRCGAGSSLCRMGPGPLPHIPSLPMGTASARSCSEVHPHPHRQLRTRGTHLQPRIPLLRLCGCGRRDLLRGSSWWEATASGGAGKVSRAGTADGAPKRSPGMVLQPGSSESFQHSPQLPAPSQWGAPQVPPHPAPAQGSPWEEPPSSHLISPWTPQTG